MSRDICLDTLRLPVTTPYEMDPAVATAMNAIHNQSKIEIPMFFIVLISKKIQKNQCILQINAQAVALTSRRDGLVGVL